MRNKLAETQQAFNHEVFIILNKTVYELNCQNNRN